MKFKQTRDFFTLKEAVAVQEALPFVQSDLLDELAWKRVARFLNILGLLAKSPPFRMRLQRSESDVPCFGGPAEGTRVFLRVFFETPNSRTTRYCVVDSAKEYRFRYHHKSQLQRA